MRCRRFGREHDVELPSLPQSSGQQPPGEPSLSTHRAEPGCWGDVVGSDAAAFLRRGVDQQIAEQKGWPSTPVRLRWSHSASVLFQPSSAIRALPSGAL